MVLCILKLLLSALLSSDDHNLIFWNLRSSPIKASWLHINFDFLKCYLPNESYGCVLFEQWFLLPRTILTMKCCIWSDDFSTVYKSIHGNVHLWCIIVCTLLLHVIIQYCLHIRSEKSDFKMKVYMNTTSLLSAACQDRYLYTVVKGEPPLSN